MQSASSRFWTCVAVSISYDDNHYTTSTSIKEAMKDREKWRERVRDICASGTTWWWWWWWYTDTQMFCYPKGVTYLKHIWWCLYEIYIILHRHLILNVDKKTKITNIKKIFHYCLSIGRFLIDKHVVSKFSISSNFNFLSGIASFRRNMKGIRIPFCVVIRATNMM